jgi:ATP-dependent RNA helicase RhlE
MGAAQTGTGKTAAFSLPLLQRRCCKHENGSMSPARHPVRALVLAPTRELADQVAQNVKTYAKHTNCARTVVFGGIDMKPQTLRAQGRRRGADRHAGPPAGPHRGQERGAQPGRVRGARRGRPHARHRLPARPAAHPVLPAQAAPDAAVLGHLLARDQAPGASYLQDPVWSRWRGPTRRPPTWSSASTAWPTTTSGAPSARCCKTRGIKQAIVFVNSKLGAPAWRAAFERDGLKTTALHGDKSQDERLKRWRPSRPARSTCWWPPTWPRAAWTSQGPAGGVQLRRPVQCRRLRAPHRPHRPRRCASVAWR